MPVQIDVFDFKCFNQLRNGDDFSLNTGEYTPNLVGNIGEKIKVEYTANIQQFSAAEDPEQWFIINDPTFKQIERSTGSFLEDGIQVGDIYLFYDNWQNRRNVAEQYSGTVEFISSDGKQLRYSVNAGTDSSSGEVTNVGISFSMVLAQNLNDALFVKFGLIGNDETFNFVSKTTGSQQIYYVSGLSGVPKDAESLGSIKDWVSGGMTVELTGENPDFRGAQYIVTHDFILNPFYILAYREFIDAGTIPELLAGESSIKYAAELEFRKTLTNTGSAKIGDFDGLNGFVGWYGENFNGLNLDYEVTSVSYEDNATGDPLESININAATKITIVVSNLTAAITDYSCAVYLIRIPTNENQYIGTKTDLIDNFLYKSEIISSPATSTPNLSSSLVSGNLVLEYVLDFDLAEKLALTTNDEFMLLVQVEDPTIAVGNSDRVMLIAALQNFADIDYVSQFINIDFYSYLTHGQVLGEDSGQEIIIVSNEDGILMDAIFSTDTAREVVINSFQLQLLAYDPIQNDSFIIDSYNFNIGDPVLVGGIQDIAINTTRGYPLPAGDDFNLVRVVTAELVGTFQRYNLQIGQKISWQDWIFNPRVPDVFFDSGQPNNNLNEKTSNYAGNEGYNVHLALVANVTGLDDLGRSITGDFVSYGAAITVNDYEESEDGVTGVIQTFDLETGNSLQGNILYNGKDTLFRAVFENASEMQYAIHRIEPSQNPGDGILEMSSLYDPAVSNLLKPLIGQTRLKFDLVGSTLTTECLIDGGSIQEGISYKLSARTGSIPIGDPVVIFQTNKNPSGASISQNFNPSIVYGGADTPFWVFENGYIHYGTSITDTDGSLTGLDGTVQDVELYVKEPELITTFTNGLNGIVGTYDLSLMIGLTNIGADNNSIDSFIWFNRSDMTRLSIANNDLTGAYSIAGCGFVSGDIDFSNNNISAFDISGVTGTVSDLILNNNALLGIDEDFDQLTFTSQATINISSTNYGACTFTQSCNLFNANNANNFSVDVSLITFAGANVNINFGSTNVAWSNPTMVTGTLSNLNINNTPSSGTYSDSWVNAYSSSASVSIDNTSYSTFNLNKSSGNIFSLSITGGSTTKTINLSGLNLGRSSDGRLDFVVDGVNSFTATDNTYIIEDYLFTLSNGAFALDLTNLDTDKPTANSTLDISDLPNATITLPNNVTKGILSFQMERTPTNGVSISTMGANALSLNNCTFDFKGACSTTAEVNRVLVELDSISSGGFSGRTIDIAGTNPAPDSSTGGNDGSAAAVSLILKGFSVLTN